MYLFHETSLSSTMCAACVRMVEWWSGDVPSRYLWRYLPYVIFTKPLAFSHYSLPSCIWERMDSTFHSSSTNIWCMKLFCNRPQTRTCRCHAQKTCSQSVSMMQGRWLFDPCSYWVKRPMCKCQHRRTIPAWWKKERECGKKWEREREREREVSNFTSQTWTREKQKKRKDEWYTTTHLCCITHTCRCLLHNHSEITLLFVWVKFWDRPFGWKA